MLGHVVVLLGGAVAVAATAGAAAVTFRATICNMLPAVASRVAVYIAVATHVAVGVAAVRAIDAGPGAGRTAFGNVYESHDEG